MTKSDLIAQLSDAGDSVRACAAYNLGTLGGDEAVSALLALFKSRKAIDRRAAALALGKIASPITVATLQNALNDRDAVVKRFAEEAISGMRRAA
jgi:HEAT repeat protein